MSFLKPHLLALLLLPALVSAQHGDSCLQMMRAQWHGTYHWTYRGDSYKLPMTATTDTKQTHRFEMVAHIDSETLILQGNCTESQVYFEDLALRFPLYLQGEIENGRLQLTGNRGPDVVNITLEKS